MTARADADRRRMPPAEPSDAHAARLRERAPSGGWRTIALKEIADHVDSVRFLVLLLIITVAAIVPAYFAAERIRELAPQVSGAAAVFLAMFTLQDQQFGFLRTDAFVAMLGPLLGIAFGFDAINVERSQGTLARLLSQPIHRDDVINGKFVAGLAVISLMLGALVVLTAGFGMVRLGIVPTGGEVLRIIAWLLVTILYVAFWLAFSMLVSVVVRRAASAALIGFGTWLALVVFGGLIIGLIANVVFPVNQSGTIDQFFSSNGLNEMFSRISPHTLYGDAVTVILNPGVTTVFSPSSIGQYFASQEQIPSLLSVDQSLLLVWPQIVGLVALTVVTFGAAYALFLRQEVRA
jgi:ABC-2 type transport system permease protein